VIDCDCVARVATCSFGQVSGNRQELCGDTGDVLQGAAHDEATVSGRFCNSRRWLDAASRVVQVIN